MRFRFRSASCAAWGALVTAWRRPPSNTLNRRPSIGSQAVIHANNEKWQRYEQALLEVLGCDQFPPSETASSYQLLIIPVFHAPCCLRLTLTDQDGELSVALLTDRYADVF